MSSCLLLLTLTALMSFGTQVNGRHLVFEQDFTKLKSIDLNVWKFDDGPVYNDELEKYTDINGGNAFLENGALVLEARKKGSVITSARLQSIQHWKYGYIEVEAKVPQGNGTWPAIWMLNDRVRRPADKDFLDWPRCGEIDIMENVGYDPGAFHFSLHSENFNFMKNNQATKVVPITDYTKFHKFAVDWNHEHIKFLVDGKSLYEVARRGDDPKAWPFDDSFFLILNLAIGGNWGGSKGVDDSIFPSRYYIKSVKVYQ